MINQIQMTLYPDISLNDEHIEKINKLYGTVAQKTLGLGKKPRQIKQIISEMVFSSGHLSRLLKSQPLSAGVLPKAGKIIKNSRAAKTAKGFVKFLKLKESI